jgi:hypothetical protein
MEEKLLKLMAQLGLVAIVIWVVCMAVSVGTPAPATAVTQPRWPLGRPKGPQLQQGGVVAPYAQTSYQAGFLSRVT